MKRKIGILGGTFNPIHFGHINLALELKEKKDLEEIWFIPSLISPFRMQESFPSSQHRMEMLRLALSDIPGFDIWDLEMKRPPPSYTVDTIKEILSVYPNHTFFLLFGEDTLKRFREWKEPLEIVRNMPLLIGSRPFSDLLKFLPALGFNEEISSAIRKGLVSTRQIEISATEIRERLKKELCCKHLLPKEVLDYICENQLYSMPQP